MTNTEPRVLLAGLISTHYAVTPAPDVVSNDAAKEPMNTTPLIKVYPIASPARPKGCGYTHREVRHRLTVLIKCRDQDNASAALQEVLRVLGAYRIIPFTGYDLIEYDDGTYRGGSTWLYQWAVEVTLIQFRKPI